MVVSLDAGIGKAMRFSVELAVAGCHKGQMEGQASKSQVGGEQEAEGTEQKNVSACHPRPHPGPGCPELCYNILMGSEPHL